MERVVLFGCAGSGKSTMARKLSLRTGLPVVERDSLGILGSQEYLAAVGKLAAQPRWILDGPPYHAEDVVFPKADTVIALDYPKPVVMWRVLRRTVWIELFRRPAGRTGRRPLLPFATRRTRSAGRGALTGIATARAWP